jgi:hypothetical protein
MNTDVETLDNTISSSVFETDDADPSGMLAIVVGAISGGTFVGLLWLFSTVLF